MVAGSGSLGNTDHEQATGKSAAIGSATRANGLVDGTRGDRVSTMPDRAHATDYTWTASKSEAGRFLPTGPPAAFPGWATMCSLGAVEPSPLHPPHARQIQ